MVISQQEELKNRDYTVNREDFIEPKMLMLDFEFNGTTSECVNLVSCVTYDPDSKQVKKFWLHNSDVAKDSLRKHLQNYKYIMGYSCVAEARSFYSLNLDPLNWGWIDLFLEYRMLSNHNDKLNWGEQLVDGKVKKFSKPPPKWERTEQDNLTGFKPTHSLAEATFKLTGEIRDTEEKTLCRDLILSAPATFKPADRERILKYNADDVQFLEHIWEALKSQYKELVHEDELDWAEYFQDALWRGRYSAHTAIMESVGYPINYEATKNFSRQIPSILAELQRDINDQFKGKIQPFKWNAKDAKYSWNQKATREWLEDNGFNSGNWMLTEKDSLSLSLEAFERQFQFKHDYPRGNFGAQMVRFLKLKQSLYGFADAKGGRKTFWSSVGPDKRVRPYMNIYGAQSGRSQPGATGFMFLKPAWMRALVQPEKGSYLAGIDYGQQEFFLAAILSEDEKMIEAYLSGDPYLFMGKEAGAIPPEGTKKTHEAERDMFKATTLGILFMMSKYGLSAKLTADTGKEYTEEDAEELINTFEDLFPVFTEWRKEQIFQYEQGNAIRTLDGWVVWTDNDNFRSVGNAPIQGAGASIMRKAVDLAVADGVKVIFTLHDAIYIESKMNRLDHITRLHKAMREAFSYYFRGSKYEAIAAQIKLDPKAWGPDFPEKGEIIVGKTIKVPVSQIHIDGRARADYDRFSKYFSEPETDLL